MKKFKFIIVDDNNEFRKALRALLEIEFSAEIIAEASNGKEFLNLVNSYQADYIFMDIYMPEMNGIEVTKPFLWKYPQTKVIAVTMHIEKMYLLQLIEIGFKGCIFKNNVFDELKNALDTIEGGKLYFPSKLMTINP